MKGTFTRELRIDATRADSEARTVEASVSSEYPVERHFGTEVLEHTKDAIDLARMPLPVIESHEAHRLNVGVFERARIEGGKLRGVLRFGRSQRAVEIFDDIRAGIVTAISIGYEILRGSESDDGTIRITRWRPLEVSLVSVPADPSVGIGRSYEGISMSEVTDKLSRSERRKQRDDWDEHAGYVGNDAGIIEAERVKGISQLGARFDVRDLADRAIQSNTSMAEFQRQILDNMESKQARARPAHRLDMSPRETERYSLFRAIRSLADPRYAQRHGGFEMEVSGAIAQQVKREAKGLWVPDDIWTRDVTTGTGTGTSKGGYLKGTDHLGSEYIDLLRARSAVLAAGARSLTGLQGDIDIPALATGTAAYWVGEGDSPTEGAPVFTQKTATPKTVGAYVDLTRRIQIQGDPSVEMLVKDDMVSALGAAIDQVSIQGGGTNQPTGVLGTSGIGSVTIGTNGGAPTWATVVDLMGAVDQDDALVDGGAMAYITTAGVVGKLLKTPRQASGVEGAFIMQGLKDGLLGFPVFRTSNCPSNLTKGSGTDLHAMLFGNWRDLILAFWSGIDVTIDPYSLSTSGGLRVVVFQDLDIVIRHGESFSECNEIAIT